MSSNDPPVPPILSSSPPQSSSNALLSLSPSISRASYPPPPRPTKSISKLVKRSESLKVDDAEVKPEGPAGLKFSIRFTSEGQEDLLDVWVEAKESVRDVKRRIRFLRPSLMTPEGRPLRLRLIQLGRLLTDGTFLVPYTVQLLSHRAKLVRDQQEDELNIVEGVRSGSILQAMGREIGFDMRKEDPKDKGKGKGKEKERHDWEGMQTGDTEEDKTIWLHCSVGEAMEDDEIEGERVQTTQIKPLEGFDRLLDAGFSEEEIATMREEFRRTAAAASGDDDEHARALEDQWMEGLTGQEEGLASTFDGSPSSGDQMELLKGMCIGFFVPFLPFFFFRASLFSRQTQMGIVIGTVGNVGLALIRMMQ